MIRRFRAFQLLIEIDADDAALFALLDQQLPPFLLDSSSAVADVRYRVSSTPDAGQVLVVRGRRTIATAFGLAPACDRLVADLQSWFSRLAAGWTFIHAGVVAIDERVLLLPAHSGAGKTTLVEALLREGARYASDEFAVVDDHGLVHPYSRQLARRSTDRYASATDLGATTMTEPLRVASIVFTRFEPLAAGDFVPLPSGQAVLRLLEHCPGARERPAETLRALNMMVTDATAFTGVRGDADEAARALIARVRAP